MFSLPLGRVDFAHQVVRAHFAGAKAGYDAVEIRLMERDQLASWTIRIDSAIWLSNTPVSYGAVIIMPAVRSLTAVHICSEYSGGKRMRT
jgi:hypothetical protein